MSRVYNFSAGPAVLPEEVLKEAAAEMLDYKGCGMSVMEMSHRSSVFQEIIETAEADIRDLMQIPDNYKVLFLQGGASQQFAMIPMNLMKNKVADYIVTGQWAKKAAKEAEKYGEVHVVASSEDKTFSYIPDCSDLEISEDADYVYICENNTIYGTKFKELPDTKGKTLVADVSSCFLSEPVDVSKYGVIYGGVQKNVGPAGVVIAIIREDLITDDVLDGTPTMLKYKTHADAGSLYNTPPAYGIYICGKVFKWLKKQGGLEAIKERNEKKAKILYDYLDESKLFKGTVVPKDRSLMNVPFITGNKELDAKFVKEATGQDKPLYKIMETMAEKGKEFDARQLENRRLKIETTFDGTRVSPELGGSITNLFSDNFTPESFTYGVLEGMSRELYNMYQTIHNGTDIEVKHITGSGNGLRKNKVLCEIVEEMFGAELVLAEHEEEAAVGAAISGSISNVNTCKNC